MLLIHAGYGMCVWVQKCVCAYVCACVGERARGGEKKEQKTYVCTCVCAYVCRMCLSALFEYVAFRHFVPVKESFVGSEYASVYERMCSSVTLQGWGSGRKAFTGVEDNHTKCVYV